MKSPRTAAQSRPAGGRRIGRGVKGAAEPGRGGGEPARARKVRRSRDMGPPELAGGIVARAARPAARRLALLGQAGGLGRRGAGRRLRRSPRSMFTEPLTERSSKRAPPEPIRPSSRRRGRALRRPGRSRSRRRRSRCGPRSRRWRRAGSVSRTEPFVVRSSASCPGGRRGPARPPRSRSRPTPPRRLRRSRTSTDPLTVEASTSAGDAVDLDPPVDVRDLGPAPCAARGPRSPPGRRRRTAAPREARPHPKAVALAVDLDLDILSSARSLAARLVASIDDLGLVPARDLDPPVGVLEREAPVLGERPRLADGRPRVEPPAARHPSAPTESQAPRHGQEEHTPHPTPPLCLPLRTPARRGFSNRGFRPGD